MIALRTIGEKLESNAAERKIAIEELEAEQNLHYRVRAIEVGLVRGFTEKRLGKYGLAACFLTTDKKKFAALTDHLPEGKTEKDLPDYFELIDQSDAAVQACPVCGQLQPLIHTIEQTLDSDSGDEWKRELLLVCCNRVHVIESNVTYS